MRFWDTSAILPILTAEKNTAFCKNLVKEDHEFVIWFYTPVEIFSALYRKKKSRELSEHDFDAAVERLQPIKEQWFEVPSSEAVRQKAQRLLAVHPLRAADALQLAAALAVFSDRPEGRSFVCFDRILADAAKLEGFDVIRG